MHNRSRLLIFLFFLILSVLLIFLLLRHQLNAPAGNPEITLVSSAEVGPANYKSQYTAERLMRGYVQAYDKETQTLSILYQINSKTREQIITQALFLTQTVYCWPQFNNGVDISKAYMQVDPQTLIYIQGEEIVLLADIVDQIVGKYVFLQTTEQGGLAKLAIIACHD